MEPVVVANRNVPEMRTVVCSSPHREYSETQLAAELLHGFLVHCEEHHCVEAMSNR